MMPWQGIEWAIPLYQLAMLVLPIYCFVALRRWVVRRGFPKYRALRRYVVFVVLPVVAYASLYIGLIGLEQLTKAALIPAEMARSFFILIGLGIAVWLLAAIVFAIVLLFATPPAPMLDLRKTRPSS
jgi:hypothetical protein